LCIEVGSLAATHTTPRQTPPQSTSKREDIQLILSRTPSFGLSALFCFVFVLPAKRPKRTTRTRYYYYDDDFFFPW
jgi:hypothetical protein